MSNIIPPLLSDSPPPIVIPDEEEDEFGDFNSAIDISHVYENLSLPSTPQHEPLGDLSKIENCDINSNTNIKNIEYKNHINGLFSMHIHKDFQDKRKSCDITMALTETDVNLPEKQHAETVNNYKNSTSSCETIENTQRINNEVLPNESVPIGILTRDDMSDSNGVNNVPEKSGKLNQQNNVNCSDVPFSNNESMLDGSKNSVKENSYSKLNVEISSCDTNDNDESGSKSNLHPNIVPNMTGIKIEKDIQESISNNFEDEFYFTEEPPDLHVIDDSKVQVEDFHYYGSYDEHETHHDDCGIADKVVGTVREDVTNITAEPSTKDITSSITNDNLSIKIDTLTDNNMTDIQIPSELQENFDIQNSTSNGIGSTSSTVTSGHKNWETEIDDQYTLDSDKDENSTELNTVGNIKEFTEKDSIIVLNEELNFSSIQTFEDKGCNSNIHNLEHNKTFSTETYDPTLNENNAQLNEISKEAHFEIYEGDPKMDEVDSFCDSNNVLTPPVSDKNNTEIEVAVASTKCDNFACFDDATFSTNYIDNTSSACDSRDDNIIEEDDEFGDFGDYTQSDSGVVQSVPTTAIKINKEEILKNVDRIVSDMYPTCDVSYNDFVLVDVLNTNSVFKSAKDVTETNALMYQWTKSTSQDRLLKALNIDTRNILYGPAWNSMMPKYAANLGLAPLEPVKFTDIASTSSPQFSNSVAMESNTIGSVQMDIPSAQFDWNGSGLINPLDCTQNSTMLLDLEHLVASLDLTHSSIPTTQTPSPSEEFDEWEYWLNRHSKDNPSKISEQEMNLDQLEKTTDNLTPVLRARFHSDNESVKSLQLSTDNIQDSEESSTKTEATAVTFENEFDQFTSYQTSKHADYTQWSNTTLPLRETYISTERNSEETRDKSYQVYETLENQSEADDEFTDFQMSLPDPKTQTNNNNKNTIQDDFRVFNTEGMLQPVIQPLKPTIVATSKISQEPTHINWPNPGITDEDILNIELSYSRKDTLSLTNEKPMKDVELSSNRKVENAKPDIWSNSTRKPSTSSNIPDLVQVNRSSSLHNTHNDNQKVKENPSSFDKKQVKPSGITIAPGKPTEGLPVFTTTSKNNDDEDDWSDFVCNPEPMKPTLQPDKLPKPELRLSVPHLSQLQQPKKPIPVITPHGLIQTRIPSNISNISNLNVQQPSSVFQQNQVAKDTFQPSIISHQYQNHMNGLPFSKTSMSTFFSGLLPQQVNQAFPNPNVGTLNNMDDDEDWTDFISSPPVQTGKKVANTSVANTPRTNVMNSSSVAIPNIIANPVHVNYNMHGNKHNFGSHARNARKPPNNVNFSGQASIPSISALPDLDFIAPKNRTFAKK